MDIVRCRNIDDCPIEHCPFRYGVDFDHMGETFPVNILKTSDTYQEYAYSKEWFRDRLKETSWYISCRRVFNHKTPSGCIEIIKEDNNK